MKTKEYYELIAERIKEAMADAGLTWRALEARGIPQKTLDLALKEPGNRTLETLRKIAEVVGLTLPGLLDPVRLSESHYIAEDGSAQVPKNAEPFTVYLNRETIEDIKERAENLSIDASAYASMLFRDLVSMDRVICPECDNVFCVSRRLQFICCPYCGAKVGKTIDDFIIE